MFVLQLEVIIDTTDKDLNPLDDTLVRQAVAFVGDFFNNNYGGCFITVGEGYWEGSFEKRYIVSTTHAVDADDWASAFDRRPFFDMVAQARDMLNQSGVYTIVRHAPGMAVCL
jgi:hypothetical protein